MQDNVGRQMIQTRLGVRGQVLVWLKHGAKVFAVKGRKCSKQHGLAYI